METYPLNAIYNSYAILSIAFQDFITYFYNIGFIILKVLKI